MFASIFLDRSIGIIGVGRKTPNNPFTVSSAPKEFTITPGAYQIQERGENYLGYSEISKHDYAEVIFSRSDAPWIQDTTKAYLDRLGNVVVSVYSNRDYANFEFHFQRDATGNWIYQNKNEGKVYHIPRFSTLHDFALGTAIVHQIYLLNKSKFSIATNSAINTFPSPFATSQTQQESKLSPCMSHNLVCDVIGDTITLPVLFCFVDIDILHCCIEHDINLWCGSARYKDASPFEAYNDINTQVSNCVTREVFKQLREKTPWYCGGEFTGTLFGIVEGLIVDIIAYTFTMLLSPKGGDLFPDDDRHLGSCLCGGTQPTVQCDYVEGSYGECVDLCKKFGKKETCYNCRLVDCIYKNGRLERSIYDLGPNNDPADCCPDTSPQCLPKCRTCNKCMWGCDEQGRWTILRENKKDGLPCCNEPRPRDARGNFLPCKV